VTKGNPAWEKFEHDVQDLLNLRSTPGSGNQWHDVSDGRSRSEDPYKLMVDCKHTERSTYSLAQKTLAQWWDKAAILGYRVAIPVRFDGNHSYIEHRSAPKEWVTVSLDDYAELVDAIRILNGPKRCGVKANVHQVYPCCRRLGHFGHHDNGEMEWSA